MSASATATPPPETPSPTPLFRFGVIADGKRARSSSRRPRALTRYAVQYADAEDAFDFKKTTRRYYRHALVVLRDAVAAWRASPIPVCFVAQLGDLIDGRCKASGADGSLEAVRAVLATLSRCECPVFHCIGNHEVRPWFHSAWHRREEEAAWALHRSRLPFARGIGTRVR